MKEALIYAAGFGTRMGELTKVSPKPMLEIAERPMIDHVVEILRKGGISKCHVNTHYLSEQIKAHFENDEDVHIHDEPDGPYETGGTLKKLVPILPETIVTINSDALFANGNPVGDLRDHWRNDIDALLLCVPVEKTLHYGGAGDFYIESGAPIWRGERASAPYVFTGLQIIRPHIATGFEDDTFSSKVIWQKLMDAGRIGAAVYDGQWIDIGTKEALDGARKMMAGQR